MAGVSLWDGTHVATGAIQLDVIAPESSRAFSLKRISKPVKVTQDRGISRSNLGFETGCKHSGLRWRGVSYNFIIGQTRHKMFGRPRKHGFLTPRDWVEPSIAWLHPYFLEATAHALSLKGARGLLDKNLEPPLQNGITVDTW